MTDQNLWVLIRPGGPAGLTWAVVAQTGQGDFDTVREVTRELREILDRDLQNPTQGSEDYIVRSVGEAITKVSRKPR